MDKYKRNYAKWDDFTNKYPDLARIMNLHNIQEFTFGNSRIHFTNNGVTGYLDLPGLLSKADLQKYFTKRTMKKYTLIKQLEFASLSSANKEIVDILAKLTNNKFIFEMDSENRTTIYIDGVPVNSNNYRLNPWFTTTEIGKYVVPVVEGDILQKCQVSASFEGLFDNSVQVKTQVNISLLNWLLKKAGYTSVLSAQRAFNTERQTEISTIEKQIKDLQAKLSKLRS